MTTRMHKIAGSLPMNKESADCDVLIDEGQQQRNPQDVHATLKTSRGENKEIKVRSFLLYVIFTFYFVP